MNPYTIKREQAEARVTRIEQQQDRLNGSAIPGTFITGNSGVSARRRRQLDRQLNRTIDLAVAAVRARERVRWLRWQEQHWQDLLDNPPSPKPEKKRRPWSAKTKELKQAILMISIDGHFTLSTGHTIQALVGGWDEERQTGLGIIQVTTPEGEAQDYRAKSMQGVHLEEMEDRIIRELLQMHPRRGKERSEGVKSK